MEKHQRRTRSEWRDLIEQQKQSELNAVSFCKERGLSINNFYKWQAVFKKEAAGFSRIPVKRASVSGSIRCFLPNGLRLEWDESVSLSSVLSAVEALT